MKLLNALLLTLTLAVSANAQPDPEVEERASGRAFVVIEEILNK